MSLLSGFESEDMPGSSFPVATPFPANDLFALNGPVGRDAANDRADVIRAQMMLNQAGYLDLPAGGPTGWPGDGLNRAIRSYQRDNGLAADGLLLPENWNDDPRNGETLRSLQDRHGAAPVGPVPTPAEVDAQHETLAQAPEDADETRPADARMPQPQTKPAPPVQVQTAVPVPQSKPAQPTGLTVRYADSIPRNAGDGPTASSPRSLSDRGTDLLRLLEKGKLRRYPDQAGHPTIGYGHRILPEEEERFRNGIDESTARELLARDVTKAEQTIRRLVKVPLDPSQFDALTIFAYNIGATGFEESTALKKLNQGDYRGAADAMLMWNKVTIKGQKVPSKGLTDRRQKERNLFLDGRH